MVIKMKKIPYRMCSVTKERLPKKELIRIVRTKEGEVLIDATGKVNGKGAYLKKDLEVIEKAFKSKILNRYLEVEVKENIYEKLKELV